MKAAAFDYARVNNLPEAVKMLGEAQGAAKILAGGQSLGPMLNLRLVRPELLVDLRAVEHLRTVDEEADGIRYGALLTHASFEDGKRLDPTGGLLRFVAGGIAYRAVRNRGTLGGSLAHADPAADWLATFTALEAELEVEGPGGGRRLPLSDAVVGAFTTTLEDDEILTAVRIPRSLAGVRWGYHKICKKVGEFAEASAVVLHAADRRFARVVAGAIERPPLRLPAIEEALLSGGLAAAVAALPDCLNAALPERDAYERQLHKVAFTRALEKACA